MSDRTPGRDSDLAGEESAMKRAAKAARERAADADMDYEKIRTALEARPSNVLYLADWLLDAKLAYRLASEAALASNPEDL